MTVAFVITALIIVATPGTGALYTISTGLTGGTRAGLVAAVGCTLGIVPHLVAAITGTAALLRASGEAFEIVKFAGVAYLLYLAWTTWRDKSELVASTGDSDRPGPWRITWTAVTVNVLNPKLTIFFFAFLPQFAPPHSHDELARLLELSGVFMAMTLVVFALYGVFAAAMRSHVIDRPAVVRRMRQTFAVSFVGLSAKLAVTHR